MARRHPLVHFYVLAFAIAWLGWLPVVAGSRGVAPFTHPAVQLLLLLPLVGPALAAIITTGAAEGRAGVRTLLAGMVRWRVHPAWHLAALLGPAVLFLGGRACDRLLGTAVPPAGAGASALVGAFVVALIANPWEEVGWRGFALPRLQARSSALAATVVVGLLWGLWHLPLFFWAANPMSGYPFPVWLLGLIGEAVAYTWLYNSSGGSLLIVSLFHISINTLGPALGGSQTGLALANLLVAALLVLLTGPARLARRAGQTTPG